MRLALLLCLSVPAIWAQIPAPPFAPGETLDYDISWRIFGAGKARMSLALDPTTPPVWRATVEANSAGIVSRLYKVEDVFRSTFLNGTLCSRQILKNMNEGARHREIHIDFQEQRRMAVLRETDTARNRPVRQAENPIPPCAFDVVSALYYVRTQNLDPGKTFQVPLNDGGRTILIDVEVQGREEIKTPSGVFQTIRIEPQVFGGTLFKRSGRMQVWLSDDASHRLIQLKARLFIGTITAVLTTAH
jgi:hypothetical protein